MKDLTTKITYIIALVSLLWSCSKMNDKHDMFLAEGERIYIGKIDSLNFFPGENRVKLLFWVSDPRCKSIELHWSPFEDSLKIEIEKTAPIDSFEVVIGGENSIEQIKEGSYTLTAIAYDNLGNKSITYEKAIKVYGDKYRSLLTNRILSSLWYEDKSGELILYFSNPINEDDIGFEVLYVNREGETKNVLRDNLNTTEPIILNNVDVTKKVSYRTMFLPNPLALDTFYTAYEPIKIIQTINVALHKPVVVSDILKAGFEGENAVDGIIADNSRWVSSASGEHWIEIDLEKEYNVSSFEFWNGQGAKPTTPIPDMIFQAEVEGKWQTIVDIDDNIEGNFKVSFPEVKTSKVKFSTKTQTRIFELAVYANVEF